MSESGLPLGVSSGSPAGPPALERLDRRDYRFLAICLLVIAAGAGVTALLFRRAFPEASIEFRVNRAEARALAEKFLVERGRRPGNERFAGRFSADEEPKVYLERELGLERASRLYGTTAKVWRWDMRWFRSGVKEEERVSFTPLGELVGFTFERRDDTPGPRPEEPEARAVASAFLAQRGLPESALTHVESTPTSRPKRTDWTFVDERKGVKLGDATVRYQTTVSLGEVSAFHEFVHVPESWQRDYRRLRSKNEAAGAVATLGLVLTALAMLASLVGRIVRKDIRWKLVAGFGAVGFVLSLLSTGNSIPLTLFDQYDTASPLSSFLTEKIVLGILGAVAIGALIAFVVAAAEPEYRERFPRRVSLPGLFSGRGLRTKGFLKGVVLGYALVAFFFAYQAVFYVVAARFGAWSPAEIPYDDILNTAAPWATVLLIGFLPAVTEEGISRLYSISLLERLGAGRFLALVVPAVIWGFGHAAYPNQPFFIRGLEVGLAGVVIGAVMLRFGAWPLLVWHFTVDAIYTALLMLRSKNAYYVASGAVSAGILLVPLAVSLVLARRRGGFLREEGLTNADLGTAPRPPARAVSAEAAAPVRPLTPVVRWGSLAAALVLAATFLRPAAPASDVARDETGRVRARDLSRHFLRANGVAPDDFRDVTYEGTGFADAEELRAARPEDDGRIPAFSGAAARYVLDRGGLPGYERLSARHLPVALWVTRFFRPEKKEEWKAIVDARRARIVGFVHPEEEAAPAGPPVDLERARARALGAAAAFGYPAAEYAVADVGTRDRPKRRDTTVILESRPAGVGDARPRLTAVFHGSRLAAFLPSVQVPESFVREYRKKSPFDWVLLAAKIVAIGGLAGIGFILFLRRVRSSDFHWRSVLVPTAVAAVLVAAGAANGAPKVFRAYPTESPLPLFLVLAGIGLLVVWLFEVLVAAVGFVLFGAARPGWREALRHGGSFGDALFRAAVAAVVLAGLSHVAALAATRFPALFEPDPSLPAALSTALPSYAAFWSAAGGTFGLAAVAAAAALALRGHFLRTPAGAALAIGALLLAALPSSLAGPGEFLAGWVPQIAAMAWLAFAALRLLADHAAAWVLFGAFAFGGPAIADLLSQGAAADRNAGLAAAVLVAIAVAAAIGGRRSAPAAAAA